MGNFLHRTTKAYLLSHSPNKLPEPEANYIENPDLSAVAGYPSIYWIITGDVVTLMNQAERDAVDAQNLSDGRDGLIQEQMDDLESVLRQVVILDVGEFNKLRQWLLDFQGAVAASASLSQLKSAVAALPTLNPIAFSQVKTQLRNALGS